EKVQQAIQNIFGTLTFEVKNRKWGQLLVSNTTGHEALLKLYDLLKREKILSAARKVFKASMADDSLTFYLNKQVAYAGHISFCQQTGESPLGSIHVHIKCTNPRKLVDWLAPRQKRRPPPSVSRQKR
ncbi:MAG: hypothetical protein NWF03_04015, partial [Candidatus Bathyarchaeota archaeon]|nr:hypothetical protein [Candidatus Bathyarchaeota archaeon]